MLFNVQSLETLGKLKEISGYVRMSIDKLQGIRGDLVRTDDNWREWDFPKFAEALKRWTERNPIPAEREPTRSRRTGKGHPFHETDHFKPSKKTNEFEGVSIVRNRTTNQSIAEQSHQSMSASEC